MRAGTPPECPQAVVAAAARSPPPRLPLRRSIARNRERLLALGIPSLKAELDRQAGRGGGGGGKKKAKKERGEYKARVKHEPGAPEAPARRSSRLQDAAEHPKPKPETGAGCGTSGVDVSGML